MKTRNFAAVALVLAAGMCVTGCDDKSAVASPNCAEIEKITDSAKKAELLKKCPRSGPAFKPSPAKQW